MTNSEKHYKKMDSTPVPKLIIDLAIPSIVGMLITNIYNMADTYFVGTIGVSASGAVGVTFTLMVIIQAFGFMFGHGSGSVVSRRLAAGDTSSASEYISTGFFCALVFGVVSSLACMAFISPLMYVFGSTDTILPFAKTYAFYILVSSPALMCSIVLNNCLRYEGQALWSMIGLSLGGLLNIGGDALFIFVFDMGIAGAGLSTCISQYISLVTLVILYKKKAIAGLSFKKVSKSFAVYIDIIKTGFPNLLRQGLTTLSSAVLNNCAGVYGDACVSAMSIVSRCQGFMLSVTIGVGQGYQPLAGFCYQLKKYKRLKKGYYFTLVLSSVVLFVFCLLGFIFAPIVIAVFQKNTQVVEIGIRALRFTCCGLLFIPLCIIPNMMFQSAGLSGKASLLSSLRGGLCFIPVILILAHYFGISGIQASQCIADVLAALISLPITLSFFKKIKNQEIA